MCWWGSSNHVGGVPVLARAACQVRQGGSHFGGRQLEWGGRCTGEGQGRKHAVLRREMDSVRSGSHEHPAVKAGEEQEEWRPPVLLFREESPADLCSSDKVSW